MATKQSDLFNNAVQGVRTPISAKVRHVMRGKARPGHHCHWPGCSESVPPSMWGCRRHWYMLPTYLRNRIWLTYRPGQEITQDPGREYVKAALEVREWILKTYGDLTS